MSIGKIIVKLVAPIIYNVTNDVDFIEVDTSSGGTTRINLQKILPSDARKIVYISDISNNASVGNIEIYATSGNLINNAGFITLNADGIIAEVVIGNTNKFIANLSTDVSVTTDGHTIQDNGSDLPQRQNLNFVGGIITDDALNNATIVDFASDKNFVFEQLINSLVWSVPHNLNKKCSVQVLDTNLNEIETKIRWVNNNEVEVTLNKAQMGWVYCN